MSTTFNRSLNLLSSNEFLIKIQLQIILNFYIYNDDVNIRIEKNRKQSMNNWGSLSFSNVLR